MRLENAGDREGFKRIDQQPSAYSLNNLSSYAASSVAAPLCGARLRGKRAAVGFFVDFIRFLLACKAAAC